MHEPSAGRRFFAYGSLAAVEVMQALLGRCPPASPAVLEGFARYRLRNQAYPGIVPEPGGSTDGVLYQGLDAASLLALDRFEGALYRREHVEVQSQSSGRIEAHVYVVAPEYRHVLSSEPWSLEIFRTRHLARQLREWGLGELPSRPERGEGSPSNAHADNHSEHEVET